ncbi:MAG: ribonuclease R [Firmicutes bacterium]|nr:ribonuclease R [Bacillota bacterium]
MPRGFSLAVKDEVGGIPNKIAEKELKGRTDLTDKVVVTIDGEDAKDFDDAISIEMLENKNYMLGVHIADVSYFVEENSELDKEAFSRGTSVYLIDNVVPMLPEKLSNKLCSLMPNKLRLTISCFMEVSGSGEVVNYSFCESFIKSSARMTYSKVAEILNGDMASRDEYNSFVPVFELMRELAMILRDKRMERGSIDFDFPEPKVIVDESGAPTDIVINENSVSTKIIEEFMLAANETVAKYIGGLGLPLVYRVHEKPNSEKIEQFAVLVRNMNYKFKTGKEVSPKEMQRLLFKIKGTPQQTIITAVALRSLMKARYSEENLGHFGLAATSYCHFTAPIRRYPDLIVHRILRHAIRRTFNKKLIAHFENIAEEAARQSSETEIAAVEAEREWVGYKMCEFMKDKVGQNFKAFVSSVTSFGLFVQLPSTVEGLIKMSDLDDDYYEYDEASLSLTGRRTGKKYSMGQQLDVCLAKVSEELRQIDFVLATEEQKEVKGKNGKASKRKYKKDRKNGRSKQKSKA